MVFERGLHAARSRLQQARRHGMLSALDSMKNELMLLGLASLLLLAFEDSIVGWCGERRACWAAVQCCRAVQQQGRRRR
jgi:hypothetical protein